MNNRLHNCKNPYQGEFKKVLCVCSAGLLRSPTAAVVLSQPPFNYNTRACGLYDYALVMIDKVLVTWADEIVVMSQDQVEAVAKYVDAQQIVCLDIPDRFDYRDPELMQLIAQRYTESLEQ